MVMKQIKVVTMTDCQEKDLIKIMNGTKKKRKNDGRLRKYERWSLWSKWEIK